MAFVDVYVTSECISLVFIIYCNPIFIPRCTCVMSCPDAPIGKVYHVNKSCQVIVEPSYCLRIKVPAVSGH